MGFKFFSDNKVNQFTLNEGIGVINLYQNRIENVEFCFQFNDEEPVVFANGPSDLHIIVSSTTNGNVTFNDNGKVFKIFARENINGGDRA